MIVTNRRPPRSPRQIFAVPLAMGIVSAFGLVAALVGDGAWDVAGWLALAVPLVVIGWCLMRPLGR